MLAGAGYAFMTMALAATATVIPTNAVAAAVVPVTALTAGHRLVAGAALVSPNRFVTLMMQGDGNLVLHEGGRVEWNSRTSGRGNYLEMDAAGNVGVYTVARRVLWSTRTSGSTNLLLVQNDGNLSVRRPTGAVVWNLGTRAAEIGAGSALRAGQFLTGKGGETLTMQADGNLVLRRGAAAIWYTRTYGHGGAFTSLNPDGNVVVYAADRRALWSSGPAGAGAGLSLGPDGNVALRNARGVVTWQTHTPRTTPPANPTAAQLAGQLLRLWGGQVTGLPGAQTDLVATSRNQTITNSSSCGHPVRVDIRLVRFLVQVAGRYRIKINNIVTGHSCDSGRHPQGRAVDFGGVWDQRTGAASSFGGYWGPDNPALDRIFVNYASTVLPNGGGLGQSTCPGPSAARPRAGVRFFPDVCNHQHADVG